MGRKVSTNDLVGAYEIAQRLGVARPQAVHLWRRRYKDFPKPIAKLKTAMIWDWQEIRKWALTSGRLK